MSDPPLMGLDVAPDAGQPLFAQLYDALRRRIVTGALPAGARLPPTRKLGEELGVSRTTVVTAYDQLIAEGFARSQAGSGVYVSDTGAVELVRDDDDGAATVAPRASVARPVKPFQPGRPDMRLFPHRPWARAVARVARAEPEAFLSDDDPFGDYPLRAEICRYLADWRGLSAAPEQVLVTAGSGDALEKCVHALTDEGDQIGLEDPCYPPLRLFAETVRRKTTRLAMDGDGAVPPNLRRKTAPALAVITPSSQFPLGGAMPQRRRNDFLAWAAERGGWIVEDDYDSEFRYAGRPIPALASLDRHGRTLYVGTFTKVFSTGLRLGFLVVPPALIGRFTDTLRAHGTKASVMPQRPLALFLQDGGFYRHIRRVRRIYAERRAHLIALLNEHLGGRASFQDHRAGMSLVVNLPTECDDKRISAEAAKAGVSCPPLSAFYATAKARQGLLFGCCSFSPDEMTEAMARLSPVLDRALR